MEKLIFTLAVLAVVSKSLKLLIKKKKSFIESLPIVEPILSYYLKCKKNQIVKTQGSQRQRKENQSFYKKVECVIVKKSKFIKKQEVHY